MVDGPVRFALDVGSPYAAELLESFIEAADRVGVRVIWGHLHGDSLELVATSEISQSLIVSILESKVRTKASTQVVPSS